MFMLKWQVIKTQNCHNQNIEDGEGIHYWDNNIAACHTAVPTLHKHIKCFLEEKEQ
jgi:hypothetical protein